MKTDLYTKIVLTVIALLLTINLLKDFEFITSAKANTNIPVATSVTPQKTESVIDVNIVRIDGRSINSDGIDVNIKAVDGSNSSISPFSGIPVKVTNSSDFK